MVSTRRIWARGLTPNETNKRIYTDGVDGILRGVEHFDKGTVLVMQVEVDVPHDVEVVVYE